MKVKVLDVVYKLAQPLADSMNLAIWNICFEKEGKNLFLRVYIDKDNGFVDLDDCEAMSRMISQKLDEIDPIDRSYFLEVSSVGMNRRLFRPEHFEKMIGRPVFLKLFKSFEGKKKFSGTLRGFEDSKIKLETEDEIIEVLFSNCACVKLKDDNDCDVF